MKINKTLLIIGLNQHSRSILNKNSQNGNKTNRRKSTVNSSEETKEKNIDYTAFITEEKNKAKARIQKKLDEVIKSNNYNDDLIKEFYENIKGLLQSNKLDSATTIGEIMFAEDIIGFELYKEFNNFIQKYCEKYNLIIDIKKHYNLNIQTEGIESTISKLVDIKRNKLALEKLIQKEYDKYINNPNLNTIKIIMDKVKNSVLTSFQRNEISVAEGLEIFNKELLKELNEYYKRINTIKELKNMQLNNSHLIQIVSELEENIANPTRFKQIENKIINLLADLLISEDKCTSEVSDVKNQPKTMKRKQ